MNAETFKKRLEPLMAEADIRVDGSRPWDLQVHNEAFYQRLFTHGSLGLGESYMDGWWDVPELDTFSFKILREKLDTKTLGWKNAMAHWVARLINQQNVTKSKRVAEVHYDLGNDFYEKMLGSTMQYTCAYWHETALLDEAQKRKMDLICRKISLKEGDRVLELGCGWGGFAKYAAEKYGCRVIAYNISEAQVKYARELCRGLEVEIQHSDYRNAFGSFDHVVSIGLCEHVGPKNYRNLMQLVHHRLKSKGFFLLHTIGRNFSDFTIERWLDHYIFPGAVLPSLKQLSEATEGLFVIEDIHNIGAHYDKTLIAWFRNFEKHWPQFEDRYGKRFYRMWKYYLLACAGSFRARKNQLWQIVFSKNGVLGGYHAVR